MPQLNNCSNAPYPLSAAQGGSGLNAYLDTLQFVMGGDNGPQVTRINSGVGIKITYDANNCSFTNLGANSWYTRSSGDQALISGNCIIANSKTAGALTFSPSYQSNIYNQSSRIVGIGSGLFTIYNPGGVTMYCGNQLITNQIASTAIGDCIEMITINSTTYYFIAQQGNFTIT